MSGIGDYLCAQRMAQKEKKELEAAGKDPYPAEETAPEQKKRICLQ
ncbi:MAG: hypothetical protein II409_05905 [Clostridia bacterium]|nr:hypothetical protein [Clostridia bacterium]